MSVKHRVVLRALMAGLISSAVPATAQAGAAAVCATAFSINTFDGSSPVLPVGDAGITGGVLRITPALEGQTGAAWHADKVHVAPGFDTSFRFRISNGSADGFAFVIQDQSDTARGGGGSAMGYGPGFDSELNFHPGISRSVAIEFDTFGCCGELATPHISVQTNGAGDNDPNDGFSLAHATVPAIDDAQPHVVRVIYTPGNLRVLLDSVEYINVALDLEDIDGDNILDDGGCAWLGFTGGTGAATADQDILDWTLGSGCVGQFELTGFTGASVTLAGAANVTPESVLNITPNTQDVSGAAWYPDKKYLSGGFDTTFTFQILGGTADGFAFVIQDESDAALGGTGSSLGYSEGDLGSITRSLAVEFDTFSFGPPDNFTAPHVSVQTNGAGPNSWHDTASLGHANIPAIDDEQVHTARVKYASGILEVWLDGTSYLSVIVDLQDIDGQSILDNSGSAWIGFTGANGSLTAEQNILSWSFTTCASCPNPPCTRQVVAWRSLRMHNGEGNLGIDIDPAAGGDGPGGPTVEPRGGGIQELQIEFDHDVNPDDLFGGVTIIGETTSGGVPGPPIEYFHTAAGHGGRFVSLYFDPGQLPDETCFTITLRPGFIQETLTGDVEIKLRSLHGDTTGDGAVTLSDAIHVRRKALAGTSAVNEPWLDLDLSGGAIDNTDALSAKAGVDSPARRALCPSVSANRE